MEMYIDNCLHGNIILALDCETVDDNTVKRNLGMLISTATNPVYFSFNHALVIAANDHDTAIRGIVACFVVIAPETQGVCWSRNFTSIVSFYDPWLRDRIMWKTNSDDSDAIVRTVYNVYTSQDRRDRFLRSMNRN